MPKLYGPSVWRIAQNCFYWLAGIALVSWFLIDWKGPMVTAIVAGIGFCLMIGAIVMNRVKITVNGNILTVKEGSKTRTWNLNECSIRAYETQRGADIDCVFYITDAEGKETRVECELLGLFQFEELLDDLRVQGDNAPVQKLETQK